MIESDYYDQFLQSFEWLQHDVHSLAKDKGWWDTDRDNLAVIALIISELGEAIEALRCNAMSDKLLGFSGLEEKLADTIIRIADMAGAMDLRIGDAIISKHIYNKSRSYRHGGKQY